MENTFQLSGGRVLKMVHYNSPESPRCWDNLSKMIFFGGYYHLGDKHDLRSSDYNGWDEMEKAIRREYDCAIVQPIYMYSHSGSTISTSPFSCPWDSGQLGFAIVTREDIRKNWSIKRCTKKYVEHAQRILEGEVETLDQYVRGDIYGFEIEDENGEHEDSCWGFYGDDIKENGILEHVSEEDKALVLEQL